MNRRFVYPIDFSIASCTTTSLLCKSFKELFSNARECRCFSKADAKVRTFSIQTKHFKKKLQIFNVCLQIKSVKSTVILITPYYIIYSYSLISWKHLIARKRRHLIARSSWQHNWVVQKSFNKLLL